MNGEIIRSNFKLAGTTLVVIPAIAAHLPIVEISLHRLKARYKQASFLIVSPSPDVFKHLANAHTRIAPDHEFSEVSKNDLARLLSADKAKRCGWYYQQLLKFAIVAKAPFDRVLILDADTIILREIDIAPNEFFTSKERHRPYFQHFKALFNVNPPFKSSAITNFMWFESKALREMLSEIEELHQQSWWMAIIHVANPIAHDGAFSEYETYANWYALRHGPHVEIPMNIFRRGDLLIHGKASLSDSIHAAQSAGYGAMAFELNHSKSVIHRLGALLTLSFRLRIW